MAQMGRPTVMTEETIRKLEAAFAYGASDEDACFYAGIGKTALYDYCQEHPEFAERKEGLKTRPVMKALETVVGSLGDPEHAKWYLSRKRKKDFSERIETDMTTLDQPISAIGVDIKEIAAEAAKLLKAKKTK